ncbi:MAG TPA: response regulator [Acidimicrobiales bacterium]|nr:response regulator [Acidimicrobiales bacterium]
MPDILVVSDEVTVREEVKAAIAEPGTTFRELTRGFDVLPAVREKLPDLAVLDLQIGKMGGMATSLELRLEEGAGRLGHVPVLMLLDRRADVFLARRSEAEGWMVKPLDPLRLARAVRQILNGGRYEDEAYRPPTVVPTSGSDALVQ